MPLRPISVRMPVLGHYSESSALNSPRDSNDVSRYHRKLSELERQVMDLTGAVRKLAQDLNGLRIRKGGGTSSSADVSVCPYA